MNTDGNGGAPRLGLAPQGTPPAQQAGIGKRRLLIKAALLGSTVPVVMTISRPAFATKPSCGRSHNYTSWKNSKGCQ